MSHSHDPTLVPGNLIHPVNLISSRGGWIVAPVCESGRACQRFAPFELPPPPRQRIDWLVVAGHRFWKRHQRGMATLLLIDCRTRHWTIAWPVQHCGRQVARWSLVAAQTPQQAPTLCIVGTFQVIASEACPRDHVPPHAGLHFVLRSPYPSPLSAFVRDDTGLHGADPQALLTDDCAEAIIAAGSRLRLD